MRIPIKIANKQEHTVTTDFLDYNAMNCVPLVIHISKKYVPTKVSTTWYSVPLAAEVRLLGNRAAENMGCSGAIYAVRPLAKERHGK